MTTTWQTMRTTAASLAFGVMAVGCGRDFSRDMQRLREQAAQLAREAAMAEVSPAEVAAELDVAWPTRPPEKTPEEVRALVNEWVTARVEEEFPEARIAEIRAEVEDKYRLVALREEVDFVVNGGEGVNPRAQGLFLGKDARGRYVIGERSYHRDEFLPDDLARIDEEVHRTTVETQFRRRLFLFRDDRQRRGREIFAERLPEALREHGYVEFDGQWHAGDTLVKDEMARRIETEARRIEPDMQRRVFSENGFVLKDGEWKPGWKKMIFG